MKAFLLEASSDKVFTWKEAEQEERLLPEVEQSGRSTVFIETRLLVKLSGALHFTYFLGEIVAENPLEIYFKFNSNYQVNMTFVTEMDSLESCD